MRCWLSRGIAAAVTLLVCCGPLSAQVTDTLPSVTTLSCGKDCQSATEPKILDSHRVSYPGFTPDMYPTEGLVVLRATVTKEGLLQDRKVVRLVGARIFADETMSSSKDWRYQPATRNGVAVDRPNWEIRVMFRFVPPVSGARDEVFHVFHRAGALSGEGKHAEAIEMLLPILSKPHLNFYEREAVSLQLAIEYLHTGDMLTAREYLDDVILIGDEYLPPSLRPVLWQMAVIANAKTGQFLEAKGYFEKLKSLQTVAADDPLSKIIQSVDERMQNAKPLTAAGRIPNTGAMASWEHILMRHNIAFVNVAGRLDHLTIECGERSLASPFSDKAEWHIPKDWKYCRLSVDGDPGTTFTLAETDD